MYYSGILRFMRNSFVYIGIKRTSKILKIQKI